MDFLKKTSIESKPKAMKQIAKKNSNLGMIPEKYLGYTISKILKVDPTKDARSFLKSVTLFENTRSFNMKIIMHNKKFSPKVKSRYIFIPPNSLGIS